MYKYKKNLNILRNLVVTVLTKPRNKCLKLKPLQKLSCSLLKAGCDLSLQRLIYKLTEKLTRNEAQKLKIIFENKYF